MSKNGSSWRDSGSCNPTNVERLLDIGGIWTLTSNDIFLVRDSNGNSYSIRLDIENSILEIDNETSFSNELESSFSNYNYLNSNCLNSRSKSKNRYYSMYDTSWNNHINSCIASYLHSEISIDSSISGGTENCNDNYIYNFICKNASIRTGGNGNDFPIRRKSNDQDTNDQDTNNLNLDFEDLYQADKYPDNYPNYYHLPDDDDYPDYYRLPHHYPYNSPDSYPDDQDDLDPDDQDDLDPDDQDDLDPDDQDDLDPDDQDDLDPDDQDDLDPDDQDPDDQDQDDELGPFDEAFDLDMDLPDDDLDPDDQDDLDPDDQDDQDPDELDIDYLDLDDLHLYIDDQDTNDQDTNDQDTNDQDTNDQDTNDQDTNDQDTNDQDTNDQDTNDQDTNHFSISEKYGHLWVQCENCYFLNYKKFFRSKMNICEDCGYHLNMVSSDRIELLIDPGTWNPMNEDMVSTDPIEFDNEVEFDNEDMVSTDPIEFDNEDMVSTDPIEFDNEDMVSTDPIEFDNEDMVSTDPIEFDSEDEPCPYDEPCEEPYCDDYMDRINSYQRKTDLTEAVQTGIGELNYDEPSYKDRINSYQRKTGLTEAVQTGIGELNGIPLAIGVMDFEFMGGSMGSVVGEKITRLIEYATNRSLPLIIVCASGGARMQEGSLSLMQMAKISSASYNYQLNKKLFYVSILTSPTTGGVTASFGMLGDVIIAEPNAYIAFAGKRVIEQTLNTTVPDGSQEAEYLFDKGLFDSIVPRNPLKGVLSELFQLHGFFPNSRNDAFFGDISSACSKS
uniref:acetyl-CoA carboxylase carboxyltransferase beta subunit n=1 Tax=Hydrocharis dubia TaxID=62340 RepID=UPI001F12A3FD|nr:acetyl-CoA carboxylase carboxyltransferase beta subunit [Hydrocharis dubia]UKT60839.1 acetyl-CoA carboxylase carboxyltransferase beta subunit [Hydrocharis dubia]